jgi:hypothetical protein
MNKEIREDSRHLCAAISVFACCLFHPSGVSHTIAGLSRLSFAIIQSNGDAVGRQVDSISPLAIEHEPHRARQMHSAVLL